jgi:hypothetical protein
MNCPICNKLVSQIDYIENRRTCPTLVELKGYGSFYHFYTLDNENLYYSIIPPFRIRLNIITNILTVEDVVTNVISYTHNNVLPTEDNLLKYYNKYKLMRAFF